jgi:rubrerythrin
LARRKDKNELEHLRGEVRGLEKEVRRLKRQLRNEEKRHLADPIEYLDELLEEEIKENKQERRIECPECISGSLVISDLGIKSLEKCNQCSYRKTRNK